MWVVKNEVMIIVFLYFYSFVYIFFVENLRVILGILRRVRYFCSGIGYCLVFIVFFIFVSVILVMFFFVVIIIEGGEFWFWLGIFFVIIEIVVFFMIFLEI